MSAQAESNVLGYLRRVDPELVSSASQLFDTIGRTGENREYETASADTKRRTADAIAVLAAPFR